MALSLHGVRSGYSAVTVLRGVDLVIPQGTVVALIGPNGAGKTTLLRTASGLLPPTSGSIRLDGEDVTHASPSTLAAKGLCHVPEGRAVYPHLTVGENLRLMAGKHSNGAAVERAAQAFPVLGKRLQQVAGTLSGGEQQMLAVARTYVTDPHYVLLDEISMGLAPVIVDEIFEFLARLAQAGTALLLVEQYVSKALALADLVYVLNRGTITFAGEPSELDTDEIAGHYLSGAT